MFFYCFANKLAKNILNKLRKHFYKLLNYKNLVI